jgi:sortase B
MKKSAWDLAATLARGGDHLLNAVIAMLLSVAILYGGFGVWDTFRIYEDARLDSELLQYKPTLSADGEDAPNPTLTTMQQQVNEDVCGWITVDDTKIDYPVVQGENNLSYLNWDVNKKFSLSGSIFLDYRNARDFSDRFSLIYGHHMEGNVMFGQLPDFLDATFFQNHTTGNLFTPEHTFSIMWFACLETDAYDSAIFNPTAYTDEASIETLLTYLRENATQYRDIGVTGADQIVALSTCADTTTDGRVVLLGRMTAGAQQ